MEETILTKLKDEHRELQIMLLKVERCKDPSKKWEYYDEMKKVLIPHMEAEEETIYARLKSDIHNEEVEEIIENSDYEHQEIKDTLAMLDETEAGSEEWDELFSDLKETLQFHIEEEETQLFQEAKEDFSREDLIQFASEFESAKSHASYH